MGPVFPPGTSVPEYLAAQARAKQSEPNPSQSGASGMSGQGEVFRVQDVTGRGPYRPGFSWRWSDPHGPLVYPWWDELNLSFEDAHARLTSEYHWGCGFRTMDQFHNWFSQRELSKLSRFGFGLVRIVPDVIAAETPSQVVFGTVEPLATAQPRISLVSKIARAA